MRKDVITVSFLVMVIIGLSLFTFFTVQGKAEYEEKYISAASKANELEKEVQTLTDRLDAKSNQKEEKVKAETEDFLETFFTWDSSKGERGWIKINPYTTSNARKMLVPAGEDPAKIERTEPDKTIVSKLNKTRLYYTPIDDNKANVFARVWHDITANGVTSTSQMLLDLQLVYDGSTDRWLVDDVKIQQELTDEGYVN